MTTWSWLTRINMTNNNNINMYFFFAHLYKYIYIKALKIFSSTNNIWKCELIIKFLFYLYGYGWFNGYFIM
jgi:hypothetical protein